VSVVLLLLQMVVCVAEAVPASLQAKLITGFRIKQMKEKRVMVTSFM
jgi:hypothetical protein